MDAETEAMNGTVPDGTGLSPGNEDNSYQNPQASREVANAGSRTPARTSERLKAKRKPLDTANLVLVALFAAGIGCLYLLSVRTGPKEASAAEEAVAAEVDAAIKQMKSPGARTDETTTVVDTFYYEASQRQIPVEELSRNAFIYRPALPTAPGEPTAQPGMPGGDSASAIAHMGAAEELELQSVLTGSYGAKAMISNNVLAEGQTIEGWTVKSIGAREVILARGEMEYILRMDH